MITENQKFRMFDESGAGRHLIIEVNWNPDDEVTNNCKILKIQYPDGSEAKIKKEYLNSMLFAIGTSEEQRKLLPQRVLRVRNYEYPVTIKASKDYKKGEEIYSRVKLSIPDQEEEIIGSLRLDKELGKIQLKNR